MTLALATLIILMIIGILLVSKGFTDGDSEYILSGVVVIAVVLIFGAARSESITRDETRDNQYRECIRAGKQVVIILDKKFCEIE